MDPKEPADSWSPREYRNQREPKKEKLLGPGGVVVGRKDDAYYRVQKNSVALEGDDMRTLGCIFHLGEVAISVRQQRKTETLITSTCYSPGVCFHHGYRSPAPTLQVLS